MEEKVVEVYTPTNPKGRSFVERVYGALASIDRNLINDPVQRKALSSLLLKLMDKLDELSRGRSITLSLKFYVDNGKIVKAEAYNIKVYDVVEDKQGIKLEVSA